MSSNPEIEKRSKWIKNKRGLIFAIMKQKFENRIYNAFETKDFKSAEELDSWIDDELRKFEDESRAIKNFYNEKLDEIYTFYVGGEE